MGGVWLCACLAWYCGGSLPLDAVGAKTLAPSDAASASNANAPNIAAAPSFLISQAVRAIDSDFPDPGALLDGDTFFAYATNTRGSNVTVASSTDFIHWQRLPDALPSLPSWAQANSGLTWAPDVQKRTDGSYVMYFTARDTSSGKQCVGVATSHRPAGPFTSNTTAPLVCQTSIGGTIDAAGFVASDGRRYLMYKNDGNCCGYATQLWGRQLGQDGLSFIGNETQLLSVSQSWEHNLIEAPAMMEHDGKFYLFYSAAAYSNSTYSTGVAVGPSPLGPFSKIGSEPLLASDGGNLNGPGGLTPIRDGNGFAYIFFHNWNSGAYNYRSFWVAPLTWKQGAPKVILE